MSLIVGGEMEHNPVFQERSYLPKDLKTEM